MVKLQFPLLFGALAVLAAGFEQHDYRVVINKYEILWYNKEFIENPIVTLVQFNDTTQSVSASYTILSDLGSNILKNMELYAVKETEHQRAWSLHNVNVCDMVDNNFMDVQDLLKFGNATKCPIKKGYYVVKNAVYDQTKLPVGAPRGQFLAEIDIYNGNVHLSQSRASLTVEDLPN